ncbi:AAA family ATPase [uncultured Lactobacillus sp.]|uniref:ATP-binding protein n=1 Tax=uncultured Lactobacillus sp. TaxID=153152 RepID=UPI0026288EE4|nr:AAA family ATPase [uncultured Lactobacillus sp.]
MIKCSESILTSIDVFVVINILSNRSKWTFIFYKVFKLILQSAANFIYINFENLQYETLVDYRKLNQELVKRIEQIEGKAYLFLDEIQKVAFWEKTINSLRASYDCDTYLTGSNSQLLSGELATEIAGRYGEIKVSVGLNDKKEIDFVAQKGSDKRYYQVTYILGSQATIDREFVAYDGIADNYPKYVLSMDKFDMSRNGIIHQNIIDFLLQK